jgi:glutaminase
VKTVPDAFFNGNDSFLHFYSKPLNYAIALNELGADVVHKYIGQEPSGRKFNDLDLDYNSKPVYSIIAVFWFL